VTVTRVGRLAEDLAVVAIVELDARSRQTLANSALRVGRTRALKPGSGINAAARVARVVSARDLGTNHLAVVSVVSVNATTYHFIGCALGSRVLPKGTFACVISAVDFGASSSVAGIGLAWIRLCLALIAFVT
jgi:hypothetical protein